MITNIEDEKYNINYIISHALKEIIPLGTEVDLEYFKYEIDNLINALRAKNKIYDYAVLIEYNKLLSRFEGKIAYSLINTTNMDEDNKKKYEELLEFSF